MRSSDVSSRGEEVLGARVPCSVARDVQGEESRVQRCGHSPVHSSGGRSSGKKGEELKV